MIAKFFAKLKFVLLPLLKFLPLLLKSGGTMLLMIWIYTRLWGWQFALGFVLLLLIHETGHLVVAKKFGLKVGAPVFIPFMGAFIALKEAPRNAWMEACVGIGGPMLGSIGALICNALGEMFAAPIFIALAWFGYFLNLFNLTPVGMLDGGRIVTALSRWLWLPGFALLLWFGWKFPNFIVWLMRAFVAAADLFAIPQTNRRRTALLRSHTVPALDNVDTVLRSDRGFAFRNARRPAGFKQIRSALSRSRARCDRPIITAATCRKDFLRFEPDFSQNRQETFVRRAEAANSGAMPTEVQ